MISMPSYILKQVISKNADIPGGFLLKISLWDDNVFIIRALEMQSFHHQTIWLSYSYIHSCSQFCCCWEIQLSQGLRFSNPFHLGEEEWGQVTSSYPKNDFGCDTSDFQTKGFKKQVKFPTLFLLQLAWYTSLHNELKSHLLKHEKP